MSQNVDGIPAVSTDTKDLLINTINFENGKIPVYWGPDQETSETYNSPVGYKQQRLVRLHEVVRFIYQSLNFTESGPDTYTCVTEIITSDPQLHNISEIPSYVGWTITWKIQTRLKSDNTTILTETYISGEATTFSHFGSGFSCTDFSGFGSGFDHVDLTCEDDPTDELTTEDVDAIIAEQQPNYDELIDELDGMCPCSEAPCS